MGTEIILIGMFDSPFVRRVAVSMHLLGIPFEHRNWSVGKDFERIREFNPLGRVPTLVLDDGEALIESAAILDYLDDFVGPARAQVAGALAELEGMAADRTGGWLGGDRMTQADITASCVFTFLCDALGVGSGRAYPQLAGLTGRCEALPQFQAARLAFSAPGAALTIS